MVLLYNDFKIPIQETNCSLTQKYNVTRMSCSSFFFLLIPPDPLINKKKNEKVFLCPGLSKSMRVAQYVVVLFPRKNSLQLQSFYAMLGVHF